MAVGTVSGVSDDVWQLISTNTPSAATSSVFSSISGYKKLMLVWSGNASANDKFWLRFNGDSTVANYGGSSALYAANSGSWSGGDAVIPFIGYVSDSAVASVACAVIDYANVDTPKLMQITGSRTTVGNGVYLGNAITSITVGISSGNFTGTLKLYGIAA
jgi:hypothetical protein